MATATHRTDEEIEHLLSTIHRELEYSEMNEIGLGVFKATVPKPNRPVGSWVGHVNTYTGYRTLKVNWKKEYEHRLVYLFHHGSLPDELDHIDGVKCNNRIANLRPCSKSLNGANRPAANKRKYKGVTYVKQKWLRKRWKASITFQNKATVLGYFETEDEAAYAYNMAALNLFGEFARLNEII